MYSIFYNKMDAVDFKNYSFLLEFSSNMPRFNLIYICPISRVVLL